MPTNLSKMLFADGFLLVTKTRVVINNLHHYNSHLHPLSCTHHSTNGLLRAAPLTPPRNNSSSLCPDGIGIITGSIPPVHASIVKHLQLWGQDAGVPAASPQVAHHPHATSLTTTLCCLSIAGVFHDASWANVCATCAQQMSTGTIFSPSLNAECCHS